MVMSGETSQQCETPIEESGPEILGQGSLEKVKRVRDLSELSMQLDVTSCFQADSLRSHHVLKPW